MNLDRLRAFSAFAEALSFTQAARAIHLSQPALHAQIAKLEQELGVPLYRREGRALALTPQGERVATFAREIDERIALFEADLHERDADRPVVLSAGRGSFLYLLGEAIAFFRRDRGAPLRLEVAGRDGCLEAVRSGKAHLGVAAALDGLVDDLVVEPLTEVPPVVVMPARHRLARRQRLCLRDLDGEALVLAPSSRGQRATLTAALAREGVAFEVGAEADGWDLMLSFVRLGLGLAVVNACCRIPPGLRARPLAGLSPVAYQLVRRRELAHPGALALASAIVDHADDWRERPGGGVTRAR